MGEVIEIGNFYDGFPTVFPIISNSLGGASDQQRILPRLILHLTST